MIMEVISEIEFNGDESYYLDFKNLAQSLIKGQGLSGYKVIGMVKVTYGWGKIGNHINGVYTSSDVLSYGLEFISSREFSRRKEQGTHYFYEKDKEWVRIDSLYKKTIRDNKINNILNE